MWALNAHSWLKRKSGYLVHYNDLHIAQTALRRKHRQFLRISPLMLVSVCALCLGSVDSSRDVSERGSIVSTARIGTLSLDEVAEKLAEDGIPGVPEFGVTLYRIVYRTTGVDGEDTIASGALAVPQGLAKPAPLLSFQHGTVLAKTRVPSRLGFDLISMGLGASGYVTALPDYLGLGVSPGLHPYVHASSLGSAIVDFLRASRE